MTDYEDLMKRCQRGATNLNDANNLLAECYGMLGQLGAQAETVARAYAIAGDREHELRTELAALRKDADKWKIVQRCMEVLQTDERNASIWSTCSRLLISTAHKMNSAVSTVLEEGVTIGEEPIGDWRVTVERVNMSKEG